MTLNAHTLRFRRFYGRGMCLAPVFLFFLAAWFAFVPVGSAQTLRFHLHRDVEPPDYAYVRIGPFYSDIRFSQSAGYRWTRSGGAGTDFLQDGRRGRIRREGSEWPLISTLDFRNYLLISRNADADLSVRIRYAHYPLDTQDNQFLITIPDEGIEGSYSTAFRLTPYLRGSIYDNFVWRTDYIDSRGMIDEIGGEKYEYMRNVVGVNADWLAAEQVNVSVQLSRLDHWPQTRIFRSQGRTTYLESLEYSQRFQPYWSAGARATFTQNDYPSSERSGYYTQLYALFTDIAITRRVTGSGWGGYSVVTPHSGREREDMHWGATLRAQDGFWIWIPELTHTLAASRTITESFDSTYQTVDLYRYRMAWNGLAFKAGLSAQLRDVDPGDSSLSKYRDTQYRLDASYPLTSFARVRAEAGYNIRENRIRGGRGDDGRSTPADHTAKYETLFWSVGTGFNVTRRIEFDTAYRHSERLSDRRDMRYYRDTFHATLRFTHRF